MDPISIAALVTGVVSAATFFVSTAVVHYQNYKAFKTKNSNKFKGEHKVIELNSPECSHKDKEDKSCERPSIKIQVTSFEGSGSQYQEIIKNETNTNVHLKAGSTPKKKSSSFNDVMDFLNKFGHSSVIGKDTHEHLPPASDVVVKSLPLAGDIHELKAEAHH